MHKTQDKNLGLSVAARGDEVRKIQDQNIEGEDLVEKTHQLITNLIMMQMILCRRITTTKQKTTTRIWTFYWMKKSSTVLSNNTMHGELRVAV